MEFLFKDRILKEIKKLVQKRALQNDPLNIAVAYWGLGAVDKTGLVTRKPGKVRIVCDLMSGACNPEPIRELLELGFSVRKCDGMHAKVWSCGEITIVGSANASVNGLGFENNSDFCHADTNREAAVRLVNKNFANSVNQWFDELWCDSDEIAEHDINLANERRERHITSFTHHERSNQARKIANVEFISRKQGSKNLGTIRFIANDGSSDSHHYGSHAEAVRIVLRELSQNYTDEGLLSKIQNEGHRIKSRTFGYMPMVGKNCNEIYHKPSGEDRKIGATQLENSNWLLSDDTSSKQKMALIKSACEIARTQLVTDVNSDSGY